MTVETKEYYGSGPSSATITHLKHRTDDDYTNDTTHPIPKPSAGSNYGYWKHIALYDAAGNNTDIFSDIKIYGTDPSWTSVTLYVGDETFDVASYDQATGTINETGDELVTAHAAVTAKTNFWSTYNSGNMKTVGVIGGAENVKPASPQLISKIVTFQAAVGTGASAGSLANGTITWRYSVTS